MTSLKYWLWLTTRSELSVDGMHRLCSHFGSPEAVYYAQDYTSLAYLKPVAAATLRDKSMTLAERILEDCTRLDIRITTLQDADYPNRLRNIPSPPLVLYSKGKSLHLDDEVAIAIAGTRNCSEYGRRMAGKIAREIAQGGGLVVTGVVPGCDYAAAIGALRGGGPVVCVLAGGLDIPFDQYSHSLYQRVTENGLLISEHPPGREPKGRNFPQRNRILTGLCLGTLCVEGGRKSGVMLVAKNALDQNRDVFVVPTGADRPEGAGILELLKEGAIPVTTGQELLESYALRYPQRLLPHLTLPDTEEPPAPAESHPVLPKAERATQEEDDLIDLNTQADRFTDQEAAILLSLQEGPLTADDILAAADISAKDGMPALTLLTLRGLIAELEGGRFQSLVRVRR